MRTNYIYSWFCKTLILALLLALIAGGQARAGLPGSPHAVAAIMAAPSVAASAPTITYELSMPRPVTHLYEVVMTVADVKANALDVQFPVWLPGHYRIVDAARNVQEFHAVTTGGQTLPATKIDTQTWRVETRGDSTVRISYKVYADDLTVDGIHLDDTHGYYNGALLFPYVVGMKDRPVTLFINKPANWTTISTGLEPAPGKADSFMASNYDTFIDCPTEIGTQNVLRFEYQNVPYEIAIYGNHNYNLDRFRSDIERIVRSEVDLMGGAPYKRYVFIYHMTPQGGGGLEHLNSTTIGLRKFSGTTEDGLDRFRSVTAHEFFHLWNVKRIRPSILGPFDYTRQVPTRYLYVSEGMTSYYGDLSIVRSGLWTPERYYKQQAEQIRALQGLPGRHILSVEESSINTWYTPDNARNNSFSYYTKGDLLGMLLDLEIRHRTANARSLDDVFHYLYQNYALPKPGFPPGGFEKAVETVAGSSFGDFFARYVHGTEELPYDTILGYAGLRLVRKPLKTAPPDLGIAFAANSLGGAGMTVIDVSSEGPADNVLAPNDVLLAIDGERVTPATLPFQLAQFPEGKTVPLTIFRGDRLLNVSITMTNRPTLTYEITEDPQATPEQKALRAAWLAGKK